VRLHTLLRLGRGLRGHGRSGPPRPPDRPQCGRRQHPRFTPSRIEIQLSHQGTLCPNDRLGRSSRPRSGIPNEGPLPEGPDDAPVHVSAGHPRSRQRAEDRLGRSSKLRWHNDTVIGRPSRARSEPWGGPPVGRGRAAPPRSEHCATAAPRPPRAPPSTHRRRASGGMRRGPGQGRPQLRGRWGDSAEDFEA
jgi:hypothetical protein